MKLKQYLTEIQIDKSQFLKKLGDPKKDLEKILIPLRKVKRNPRQVKELLGWFDQVFRHIDDYEKTLKNKDTSFRETLSAFERVMTTLSFVNMEIRERIKDFEKWPEVKEAARKLFYYWKDKNDAMEYLMKIT